MSSNQITYDHEDFLFLVMEFSTAQLDLSYVKRTKLIERSIHQEQ